MAVYNKDGGGSKSQVYWYNGKAYYTYAAYQSAKTAGAAAIAKAAAAATAAKAAADRAKQLAAQQAAAKAAALAAAKSSQQSKALARNREIQAAAAAAARKAQEAALARARQLSVAAAQRRELERRAAEQKKFLESTRDATARAKELAAIRLKAEQKKRQAAIASKIRTQAYQNLAQRNKALLSQQQVRMQAIEGKSPSGPARSPQQEYANRMLRAGSAITPLQGLPNQGIRNIDTMNPVEQKRAKLVQTARASGNWKNVLDQLDAQSRRSGGRYIDEALYESLYRGYVQPVQKVGQDYTALMAEASAALDANDRESLVSIATENKDLVDQFIKFYGDGRDPGEAQSVFERLTEISRRRDKLWLSTLGIKELETTSQDDIDALAHKTELGYSARGLGEDERAYGSRRRTALSTTARGPLEFSRTITDDSGRPKNITEYGVDAYIARQRAREEELQRAQYRSNMRARLGAARKSLPNQARRAQSLQRAAREMGLTEEQFAAQWENAASDPDPQVREIEIGRFINRISEDFEGKLRSERERELRSETFGSRDRLNSKGARERLEADVKAYMDSVVYALTGVRGGGMDYRGKYLPPLMKIIDKLQDPVESVISGVGDIRFNQNDGQAYEVHKSFFDTNEATAGGSFFDLPQELRKRDPKIQEEYERYKRGIAHPDGDVQAAARRRWNQIWLTGDINFVAQVAFDPLNALGLLTKPLSAARLASKFGGGIGAIAGRTGRYLLPNVQKPERASEIFDTLNYFHVRSDQARVAFAKEIGRPVSELLNKTDAEWAELIRAFPLGEEAIGKTRLMQDLLETPGVNRSQLSSLVQESLPRILQRHRISSGDPFEMAKALQRVREAVERGGSAGKATQELIELSEAAPRAAASLEEYRRGLGAGDLPGAERVAAAERAVYDADNLTAAARRELEAAAKSNAERSADVRRARGIPDDLYDQIHKIENDIGSLHGGNPASVKLVRERIRKLKFELEKADFLGNARRSEQVTRLLNEANKALREIPGIANRRAWHAAQRELNKLLDAVEESRRAAGVYKLVDTPGRIADLKRGISRVGDARKKIGLVGAHLLGDGTGFSLTARARSSALDAASKGTAYYRLNPGSRIAVIGTMTEAKALARKLGVKLNTLADMPALAKAAREAGYDGLRFEWRGSAALRHRAVIADQLHLFDPPKSGSWIDDTVRPLVDEAPIRQRLTDAELASQKARDQLRAAKAQYKANRIPAANSGVSNSRFQNRTVDVKVKNEAGSLVDRKVSIRVEVAYDKLVNDASATTTKYNALVERARVASESIQSGVPRNELRAAMRELKEALAAMDEFEDVVKITDAGEQVERVGLISRRLDAIADYHKRYGGSPYSPSVSELTWRSLNEDRKGINRAMNRLRRELDDAKTEAEQNLLIGRLANLEEAKKGIVFEADALSRSRPRARKFAASRIDRIKPSVRPQRIANLGETPLQRLHGVTQDLNDRINRVLRGGEVELPKPYRGKWSVEDTQSFIGDLRSRLTAQKSATVPIRVKPLPKNATKAQKAKFAREAKKVKGLKQSKTIHIARELDRHVGRELTLMEAYEILEGAMVSQRWRAEFGPLHRLIRARVMREASNLGFQGKPRDLIRILREEHRYTGAPPPTYARFKEVDKLHADELERVRGFRAEGQVRVQESQRSGRVRPVERLMRDSDPRVLDAKLRLSQETGLSMYAYDELRGVFSDIMVRERAAEEIAQKAKAQAEMNGTSWIDEAKKLREIRAENEAIRNFEEFASRVEYQGLPLERVMRIYEEKFVIRDLGMQRPLKVTKYKKDALDNAFREVAGFDHANAYERQRWLQGVPADHPHAKLVPRADLPADALETFPHTPVMLVDAELEKALGFSAGYQSAAVVHVPGGTSMITLDGKTVAIDVALPSGIYTTAKGLQNPLNLWHEAYHTYWLNPSSAAKKAALSKTFEEAFDIEQLMDLLKMEHVASDVVDAGYIAEVTAEMFALWRTKSPDWDKLLDDILHMPGTEEAAGARMKAIGDLVDDFENLVGPGKEGFHFGPNQPPLHNRKLMREWLVENGWWDPATGEDIRSGRRAWSMDEERAFYEDKFGYSPPWTDRETMRLLLRDKRAYERAFRDWGFADEEFEALADASGLEGRMLHESLVWGKEGFKTQRTLAELREWARQRYGDLVADSDGNFISMPWLMKADETEYLSWLRHQLSPAGRAEAQELILDLKDRMSLHLRNQYFDENGALRAAGIDIDPTLLGAKNAERAEHMVSRFEDALYNAAHRRLNRMKDSGAFTDEGWTHQEVLTFGYDLVEELTMDQAWRGLFRGRTLVQQAFHMAGWQRMIVSFNPAFPVMNIAESYGYKRGLLAMVENGWAPIGLSGRKYAHVIRSLADIGDNEVSRIFGVDNAKFLARYKNEEYSRLRQAVGGLEDIVNLPVKASAVAESQLRLDFARVMYGKAYESLRRTGSSELVADRLARSYARKMNMAYFASIGDNPLLAALNQAVPFFSYRLKQVTLAVTMAVKHPWIPLTLGKIQDEVIARNRELFIEKNGTDVGFDEDDPRTHRLWFDLGDGSDPIEIDIWDVSDWSRATRDAIRLAANGARVSDVVRSVLRMPHPLQLGIWAALTGGTTPWGKPGDWRELFWFVDLANWMAGRDYDNPKWRRDALQMGSQMLFFKGFGRMTEAEMQAMTYYAMKDAGDDEAARAFADSHPELLAYWAMQRPYSNPRWDPFAVRSNSPYARLTDATRDEFDAASAEFDKLQNALDAEVFEHASKPWSSEYRAAKQRRSALMARFLQDNPILREVWGMYIGPQKFAELQDNWLVDSQVDTWFDLLNSAPKKSAFDDKLAYAQAQVEFNQRKLDWLRAHPRVVERLYENNNALVQAWHEQELQWSEILDFQARLNLRIQEEAAKGEDADSDFIDVLYEIKSQASTLLDSESYAQVYERLLPGPQSRSLAANARILGMTLRGGPKRVESFVELPGFADYRYGNASPAEQQEMVADEKYYKSLGELAREIKAHRDEEFSDKNDWWGQLEKRGLLDRYLKENPDRRVDYEYVQAIGNIVEVYGKKFWTGLFKPENKALLEEYLRRNPDKKPLARYMRGLDKIWSTIGNDFGRFYSELSKDPWMETEYFRRNPDKAGKGANSAYAQAIGDLVNKATSGKHFYELLNQNPWLKQEYFRRHPDKAAAFKANTEYFRWLDSWMGKLKSNDFKGAQAVWDQMPGWVQQRYLNGGEDRIGGGAGSGGAGSGSAPTSFSSPAARARFLQGQEYYAALGGWIDLLKKKDYVKADEYFRKLPAWMKEKYWAKHPDQRAKMELDSSMLRAGADYFLASGDDKMKVLQRNPQLMAWLQKHGGDEAKRRGLVQSIYRAIPSNEPWLKRTFREAFPEIFSKEAAGIRRIESVIRELQKHPSLLPFYEKALELQTRLFIEQSRRSLAPPKPWEMERKKRLKKRSRRRTSRLNSHWSLHASLR